MYKMAELIQLKYYPTEEKKDSQFLDKICKIQTTVLTQLHHHKARETPVLKKRVKLNRL